MADTPKHAREYWYRYLWAESYLERAEFDEALSLAQSLIRLAGLRGEFRPAQSKRDNIGAFHTLPCMFVLLVDEEPDVNRSAFLRTSDLNGDWIAFHNGERCDLPGDGAPLVAATQRLISHVRAVAKLAT